MKQIVFENVCKDFGEIKALSGLNLNIQKGDIFGLLGHNGAGKTTALRILLGLLATSSGSVSVFGFDPNTNGALIRKKCGVLSESVGLYEPLTVYDNLVYFAEIYGIDKSVYEERIDHYLDVFDFASKKYAAVKDLSLGTKKKTAIVRGLLHEPEIAILDEPTNGLDPVSIEKLREIILSMSKLKNTTFILTTHNLHEVKRICNKIAILKQGKVLVNKEMSEIDSNNDDLLEIYLKAENIVDASV